MKKIVFLAVILAVAAGCGISRTKSVAMVGSDVDGHGCRPSAGFTWSEVRGDCVRIFEAGVSMVPEKNPAATHATYVVFSADSTRAEVFWAGGRKSLLDRAVVNQMPTWRNTMFDMLMFMPAKGGFVLMNSADGTTWLQSRK